LLETAIDPAVWRLRPDFAALSLVVRGGRNAPSDAGSAAAVELAEPGEVVWRDDRGVTCRRWNWRQSPRTRLHPGSREMWFVLERLDPMPLAALEEAGAALAAAVLELAPAAEVATRLLRRPTGV
jgi:DNA/RNA-binding domain of Phe-tRNA-synthetase-like protein